MTKIEKVSWIFKKMKYIKVNWWGMRYIHLYIFFQVYIGVLVLFLASISNKNNKLFAQYYYNSCVIKKVLSNHYL